VNNAADIAAAADEVRHRIGPGALILICGPSGAGKDTLLQRIAESRRDDPHVVFARRVVTRPASTFEDNDSVSDATFETMLRNGAFACWWPAHGHRYGIPSSIENDIESGRCVVINVSRLIIEDMRSRYARVVAVLVTASPSVLAQRLRERGRPSDGDIAQRIDRTEEVADRFRADTIIVNDGAVAAAVRQLADVIETELLTTDRHHRRTRGVIGSLETSQD
jgi:ribose 1,5-bisphosphokinase